jgi:predicted RNA-binding protein with PUA domain
LISEFEGLIDDFTIIDNGREVLTLDADTARSRYRKIYARFPSVPAGLAVEGARLLHQHGRELQFVVNGNADAVKSRLAAHSPEALETESLTLEEIFVTAVQANEARA